MGKKVYLLSQRNKPTVTPQKVRSDAACTLYLKKKYEQTGNAEPINVAKFRSLY
jgi:hypothetical protein